MYNQITVVEVVHDGGLAGATDAAPSPGTTPRLLARTPRAAQAVTTNLRRGVRALVVFIVSLICAMGNVRAATATSRQ